MTRERAAELLSDVTVLDDPEMSEAHRVGISALRQQETVTERNELNEPLTNAQKIRAMTDEELAAFINRIVICHHLRNAGNCEKCPIHPAKPCDTEGIAEWLQQPVEEVCKHG